MKTAFLVLYWLVRVLSISSKDQQPLAVFFLHLRKCGGSTVGKFLRDWLKANGCGPNIKAAPLFMASSDSSWSCTNRSAVIHFREDEYHCLPESFASIASIGSQSARLQSLPIPVLALPRVVSIVIIRHPIDRIISQWWYHGGAGHNALQDQVVAMCGGAIPNVRTAASKASASAAANSASGRWRHARKSNFEGMLELPEVKAHECYQRALVNVKQRSVSGDNSSEVEGAQWWGKAYLDKSAEKLHLYRSLHAQYVDNYAVRRFAASSVSSSSRERDLAAREELMRANNGALEESRNGEKGVGDEAVAVLASFRSRCNLRGGRKLGSGDYAVALRALKAFDAVLLTEWLGVHHDAMVRILATVLGAGAPLALNHARKGVSSSIALADFPKWSEDGRGAVWRAQQAPLSVLERLRWENSLDLELYHEAAQLAYLMATPL
mmetsp:Transcript_87805/g.175663  ORF Transcript_87805/g.175663 Transcript_87805/m.175663 type:complete len:438 (-) Transcript_87805:222-1535(-)